MRKVADWEMACYEPEFNNGDIKRLLVRDFAFPTTSLEPYMEYISEEKAAEWLQKTYVDIKWYFDCINHKVTPTIETTTLEPFPYPFDTVQLTTFCWDLGVKRTTTSSLFDQLFPLQREMSKLFAKQTALLTNYKGPVPVFSTQDADAVLKAINNSAGEALFIDGRGAAEFMEVINPVPIDPALAAEIEGLKSRMFEIAGIQEISMDMENYRSAAAVIALDQMRDAKYQNQLFLMAEFVSSLVKMFITFNAGYNRPTIESIAWDDVSRLINDASVAVRVNHNNDPGAASIEEPIDYAILSANKFIVDVVNGTRGYADIDFTLNREMVAMIAAQKYQKLHYLGADTTFLEQFLIEAFIYDVRVGKIGLNS
jgi:hypothetical protein